MDRPTRDGYSCIVEGCRTVHTDTMPLAVCRAALLVALGEELR